MKKLWLVVFIPAIMVLSCEEKLEYASKTNTIYIDARFTNHIKDSYVWISEINAFPDTSSELGISGANVIISDDSRNKETLYETEDKPGLYKLTEMTGRPGHTYTLTIHIDGKEYSAESTMLKANSKFAVFRPYGTNWLTYSHNYDEDETLHYRLRLFKNAQAQYDLYRLKLYSTLNDNLISLGLTFRVGDSVRIELSSLPPKVYTYYETIFQALTTVSEDLYSRPVYFPEGNIKGAAGIFRASEVVSKKIVIESDR